MLTLKKVWEWLGHLSLAQWLYPIVVAGISGIAYLVTALTREVPWPLAVPLALAVVCLVFFIAEFAKRIFRWFSDISGERKGLTPDEAMMVYTAPDLLATFEEKNLQYKLKDDQFEVAKRHLAQAMHRVDWGPTIEPVAVTTLREKVDVLERDRTEATRAMWKARSDVENDLLTKLREGKLVASGYEFPRKSGDLARDIPRVEWEVLTFNPVHDGAVGQGMALVDLRIRPA